jgi:putative transposase
MSSRLGRPSTTSFRRWRIDGTWEKLNATLRERLRTRLGRNARSSAGIVDSQSAKTTGVGGEQRGYDGGKKVRGILSVTCWWTQKEWCLKPRSTAPRSSSGTDCEVVGGVGVLSEIPRLSQLWLDAG